MGAGLAPIMATARKTNEIVCDPRIPVLLGEEAPRSCRKQPTREKKKDRKGERELGKRPSLKIGASLLRAVYFYLTFTN